MNASNASAPRNVVPLTTGSRGARSMDVGPFKVTEMWFPPDLAIEKHLHDRSGVVVILEGSFLFEFAHKAYDCTPATVLTETIDDKHSNRSGTAGVRTLVIQPDHHQAEHFTPCRRLLDTVACTEHRGIHALAWRLAHELRVADAVSPLAVQGLGFEVLAATARLDAPKGAVAPAWLARAEDMLHAHFLEDIGMDAVAREVGVHPVHLARVFKRYHGESIGAFVRRLRLEWAVARLATTDAPIAHVALSAGFADQSHFTRAFKRHVGVTPGRYRRAMRG